MSNWLEQARAQSRIVFLHPNGKIANKGRVLEIIHKGTQATDWRIRLDNGQTTTKEFAYNGETPPIWEEKHNAFVVRQRAPKKEEARSWKSSTSGQPSAGADPEEDTNFMLDYPHKSMKQEEDPNLAEAQGASNVSSAGAPPTRSRGQMVGMTASVNPFVRELQRASAELARESNATRNLDGPRAPEFYTDDSPSPDSAEDYYSGIPEFPNLGKGLHNLVKPTTLQQFVKRDAETPNGNGNTDDEFGLGQDFMEGENLPWPTLVEDPDLGRSNWESSNFLDQEGDMNLEGQPMTPGAMQDPESDFLTHGSYEGDAFIPHDGSNYAVTGPGGESVGPGNITVSSVDNEDYVEEAAIDEAGHHIRRLERNMNYHLDRARHMMESENPEEHGHRLEHHLAYALAHAKAMHHVAKNSGRSLSDHERNIFRRSSNALGSHADKAQHILTHTPHFGSRNSVGTGGQGPVSPTPGRKSSYDTVPTRKNPSGHIDNFAEKMQRRATGPRPAQVSPMHHRIGRIVNHIKSHVNQMMGHLKAHVIKPHAPSVSQDAVAPVDRKATGPTPIKQMAVKPIRVAKSVKIPAQGRIPREPLA